MNIPTLPESAPFSSAQRAWLNGFFAGLVSSNGSAPAGDRVAEATQATAPAREEETPPAGSSRVEKGWFAYRRSA